MLNYFPSEELPQLDIRTNTCRDDSTIVTSKLDLVTVVPYHYIICSLGNHGNDSGVWWNVADSGTWLNYCTRLYKYM